MDKNQLIAILFSPKPGTTLWNTPDAPRQFLALKDVQQDPTHHPEGSMHFPLVVDNMAILIQGLGLSDKGRLTLLLSALCHDLGKSISTFFHATKKKWVAYGHDIEGIPLAQQLLKDFYLEEYSPKVSSLVLCHMSHCVPKWSEKSVNKLLLRLQPATMEELIFLMKADCASRPPLPSDLPKTVTEELIPIYNKIALKSL